MYVCMYVCMDGWMDGWMDGRTDGWMDGCIYIYIYTYSAPGSRDQVLREEAGGRPRGRRPQWSHKGAGHTCI